MNASIIISYYKNIPNLELILLGLNEQSLQNCFEVIISEDDNDPATVQFIHDVKSRCKFPIIHVSQKDDGFRKCKALNNAIKNSNTDFLIFIDGDCIPHKKFVAEYLKHRKTKRVLFGRRVVLSEQISKKLLSQKDLSVLTILNLLLYKCERIEDALYLPYIQQKNKSSGILLGCNMAMNKEDLLAINGFDEDYTFPGGGEDSDIEWRLKHLEGVSFFSMRFKAIVYHIYHIERFNEQKKIESTKFMNKKIESGNYYSKNGLTKII